MVSCFSIVPWSCRHSCPLQWLLLPYQRRGCGTSLAKVRLSLQVRLALQWWLSPAIRWGCHTLDVRRALRHYIRWTVSFCKTEALLVSFHPASMGQKISPTTVGCWIKACISLAYETKAQPPLTKILPHSTRSAATSVVWATQTLMADICHAATWSSLSPFIRYYKVDLYASAEASFGRWILQSVHVDTPSDVGQPPTLGK